MKFQITESLINKILGHLGRRPYQEVFQLIEEMQTELRAQPEAPKTEEPK